MTEFDVKWLPGENIILEYIPPDFNIQRDTVASNRFIIALLDAAPGPVPYILDATDIHITFGDLVSVLAEGTRGEAPAYTHRNILELCVVTQNALIRFGAQAIAQTQYGGVNAKVFATRDEAITYARMFAPAFQHK